LVAAGVVHTYTPIVRREPAVTKAQRNKKILKAIEAQTKRGLASKKAARETLIKEGIYTAKGKLRVEFGGSSGKKEKAAA
jgi:hypothetical protein